MKRLKPYLLLFGILIFSVILGGCWDYTDIDTQFVVLGVGVDKDKDTGEYLLISEVSKSLGGRDAKLLTEIGQTKGITVFDAGRNSVMDIGAKLYWGHTMIYIISETVAREGFEDAINFLESKRQIKADIFIAVCDDASIKTLFEIKDPIHENVSQHLHDMLETYEASGKFVRPPLYKILQELSSGEISPMLPFIRITKEESSRQNGNSATDMKPTVYGSVVFKHGKMVGWLDEIGTRSALILKKELLMNFSISLDAQNGLPKCTIEVKNSSMDINPAVQDENRLSISIKYKLEGDIVELQSKTNYLDDKKKTILEEAFNKMLEQQLADVIRAAQNTYDSDIFGFAGETHRKQPAFWKKVSESWDDFFKSITFDISVDLNIARSSLMLSPIEVK